MDIIKSLIDLSTALVSLTASLLALKVIKDERRKK